MTYELTLTDEQLDFLHETMNIGLGHTTTVLSQMLGAPVSMRLPRLHFLPIEEVESVVGGLPSPALCVRMEMTGDMSGHLLFIIPDDQQSRLSGLIQRSMPGGLNTPNRDFSILTELGNITAGVFFRAIHDFCQMNIYHSVPFLSTERVPVLLNEAESVVPQAANRVLIIENEFVVETNEVRTFLFIIPTSSSVLALIGSIPRVRTSYGFQG